MSRSNLMCAARPLMVLVAAALCIACFGGSAWAAQDSSGQCMEKCLDPAFKTGNPDKIQAAIESCKASCMPQQTNGVAGALGGGAATSGYQSGRCISNCASKKQKCLAGQHDPRSCNLGYEMCKRRCM